jgi:starch synthase (maltosyl-transferring)
MQGNAAPPRIYNLFPRLAGDMRTWPDHARRARDMGFDWLLLNPIHFPGFSGSCYAVKDYERVDPLLLPDDHPDRHYDETLRADGGMGLLAETLQAITHLGIRPMLDLVLNHTSKDAFLVRQHPEWYLRDPHGNVQSPTAIDPADARRITVWGDLAELDHHGSSDAKGLQQFWIERIEAYLDLGFEGFRCDAAYKVPASTWSRFVAAARQRKANVLFLAETLGARLEEVEELRHSGLQYHLNSSKYWAFDASWCLEQQREHAAFMRSVGFPESHDTPRLWAETGGRPEVQRQRYAFAAAFSSGVLAPMGFEYGFSQALDVVETRQEHWETPNVDLTIFVRRVHEACWSQEAFLGESVEARTPLDQATLLLQRGNSGKPAFIAINKDWHTAQNLSLPADVRGLQVLRVCRDESSVDESTNASLRLAPAEVAYLI